MGLLDENTKNEIKKLFEEIKDEVKLIFVSKENCEYCPNISELVDELGSLSSMIKVEKYDINNKEIVNKYKIDRAPVIIVDGKNKGLVRFFGIPSGHEFGPFLMTIIDASRGESKELPNELIEQIKKIDKPLRMLVFITPSCPYCPHSVRIAHIMAIYNKNIFGDAVEAIEFNEWANKYSVRGVPKTVINDKISFEGAYPPDMVLKNIYDKLGEL